MKQAELKIAEVFDRIDDSFCKEIGAIIDSTPKILLGYDNRQFSSRYSVIISNLEASNAFLNAFVAFLSGKEKSFDLFMEEILPLVRSSDSIDSLMREKYIEHNNIQVQVTGGKIKRSFFLQAIDFTEEEEILIKTLVESAAKIKRVKIEKYDLDWYDDDESKFVFTELHKIELRESFKRYLTTDQFQELVALEVTAYGLNQLLDAGYTVEQLGKNNLSNTALGKNLIITHDSGTLKPLEDGKKGFTRGPGRKAGPIYSVNMDLFLGSITEINQLETIVNYVGVDKDGKHHLLNINGDVYKLSANSFSLGKDFEDIANVDQLDNDQLALINVPMLVEKGQYEALYRIASYLLHVESPILEKITVEELV
jgi:hypothetical protein